MSEPFGKLRTSRMVEAAGIEPAALVFEKWRRCATFVVKPGQVTRPQWSYQLLS